MMDDVSRLMESQRAEESGVFVEPQDTSAPSNDFP